MKYKLFSKKIGVKSTSDIAILETDSVITDFCLRNNSVFFLHGNSIGLVDNNKINYFWSGTSENKPPVFGLIESSSYLYPSSIFYLKNNDYLYLIENAGRIIRKIELNANFTVPMLDGNIEKEVSKIFSKSVMTCNTSLYVDQEEKIFWTSSVTHRSFMFDNGEFSILSGTGRAGYSIFNDPVQCLMSYPEGICNYNREVFITDTGNNCIRIIKNGHMRTVIKDLDKPRKIKNIDNRMMFINGNSVKFIADSQINQTDIYKGSTNIVNFDGTKNEIFVLEELDGTKK